MLALRFVPFIASASDQAANLAWRRQNVKAVGSLRLVRDGWYEANSTSMAFSRARCYYAALRKQRLSMDSRT